MFEQGNVDYELVRSEVRGFVGRRGSHLRVRLFDDNKAFILRYVLNPQLRARHLERNWWRLEDRSGKFVALVIII